jgi:hypothetical protein
VLPEFIKYEKKPNIAMAVVAVINIYAVILSARTETE